MLALILAWTHKQHKALHEASEGIARICLCSGFHAGLHAYAADADMLRTLLGQSMYIVNPVADRSVILWFSFVRALSVVIRISQPHSWYCHGLCQDQSASIACLLPAEKPHRECSSRHCLFRESSGAYESHPTSQQFRHDQARCETDLPCSPMWPCSLQLMRPVPWGKQWCSISHLALTMRDGSLTTIVFAPMPGEHLAMLYDCLMLFLPQTGAWWPVKHGWICTVSAFSRGRWSNVYHQENQSRGLQVQTVPSTGYVQTGVGSICILSAGLNNSPWRYLGSITQR